MGWRLLGLLVLTQALVGTTAQKLVVEKGKKSRGTKSLCTIPSQNMSLTSLGENDYYTAENRDDQTVIYLSLCHPLRYAFRSFFNRSR